MTQIHVLSLVNLTGINTESRGTELTPRLFWISRAWFRMFISEFPTRRRVTAEAIADTKHVMNLKIKDCPQRIPIFLSHFASEFSRPLFHSFWACCTSSPPSIVHWPTSFYFLGDCILYPKDIPRPIGRDQTVPANFGNQIQSIG
jgi:hypothetical protein